MFQIISLLCIALLIGADQLFKHLAQSALTDGKVITFIPGILQFRLVHNDAGAFGLFDGMKYVLAGVTLVVLLVGIVLLIMRKIKPMFVSCCVCAIIAGGAGNLIDRVFRGYVIDFIDTVFVNFPTYNFADCLITVGCFAVIFFEIYELIRDNKKNKAAVAVPFALEEQSVADTRSQTAEGGDAQCGTDIVGADSEAVDVNGDGDA